MPMSAHRTLARARQRAKAENPLLLDARVAKAEAVIAHTGADIRHGGNMAFSAPGPDRIHLPALKASRMRKPMTRRHVVVLRQSVDLPDVEDGVSSYCSGASRAR